LEGFHSWPQRSECRFFGKVNGALSFATLGVRRENMITVVMKSPRQAKASGGRSNDLAHVALYFVFRAFLSYLSADLPMMRVQ
jgi:hypothetical protein